MTKIPGIKPKNLIEKIYDIQCEISSVEKTDAGSGVPYKVLAYNDVNKNVRKMFEEHRVCAIPHTTSHVKNGNFTEVVVGVTLYNVDEPEDKMTIDNFVGYGVDNQDKGIGKAYSYAYKYLYLKLFNMNIGKDEESEDKSNQRKDDPVVAKIAKSKDKNKAITTAFEKNQLVNGETDAIELGSALQPTLDKEPFEFIPNNLRSSSFASYCFGMAYKNKKYVMSLEGRTKKLEEDLVEHVEDLSKNPHVTWGVENERCGIAKWMLINKQPCLDYGDNQKNYVSAPIDKAKKVVMSSTPDGLSLDKKTIIEVKCSASGRSTYKEFPRQYIPQIMGQIMVANAAGTPVEKVHLVNWTPGETKVWEIMRNVDYESKYLFPYLQDYANALDSKVFVLDKLLSYTDICEREGLEKLSIELIYGGVSDG